MADSRSSKQQALLNVLAAARALDDAFAEFGPEPEYTHEHATALASAIERYDEAPDAPTASPSDPKDELVDAIEDANNWLLAAIQCGTFVWDPDQKAAATQCLIASADAVGKIRKSREAFRQLAAKWIADAVEPAKLRDALDAIASPADPKGEHCSNIHGICSRHGGRAMAGDAAHARCDEGAQSSDPASSGIEPSPAAMPEPCVGFCRMERGEPQCAQCGYAAETSDGK